MVQELYLYETLLIFMKKKRLLIIIVIIMLVLGGSGVGFYYYIDAWGTRKQLNTWFKHARMLYSDRQYDEALEFFQRIEKKDLNFVSKSGQDVYFYIGSIYEYQCNLEEAERKYRKSIEKDLTVSCYLPLAAIMLNDKRYEEGVHLIEMVLKKKTISRERDK